MALYPEYSEIPYTAKSIEPEFKNIVSNYDELGEERRKRKWLFNKKNISLNYKLLSKTNAQTINQFYLDRSGSYESFNWFDDITNTWEGEYVGTGDGDTTVWNLPCKSGQSITIYGNSSEYSESDYTIGTTSGTDGGDNITFNVAPNAGTYITADFTGYLKVRCRFKNDTQVYSTMFTDLVSMSVQLKGLLNE